MAFDLIRSFFKPLFGSTRAELVTRFLYTIIITVIVVLAFVIGSYLWEGHVLLGETTTALLCLLVVQFVLLFLLRSGHVALVAQLLVLSGWAGITFQAWNADGIRDSSIYVYFVIILISVLLTSWRLSLALSTLSVAVIWGFAFAEVNGTRVSHTDTAMHLARDLTAIYILLIVLVFLVANTLRQTLDKMQAEILERAQAEQALRKSDERFRKIFQTSPVAIVITTLEEGRMIEANQAYWNLSGYDPNTSIGRTAFELRPGLNPDTREEFTRELRERKSIHNPSYNFLDGRGEYLNTIAFYELIEMEGETAILSMFYDMTEQNKAREALDHSQIRLRAMLEAVPDMIFELRRDGTIVQFIPSVNDDLAVQPSEFIGRKIAEVLPIVAEQAAFTIERALASGQVNAFEFQMQVGGQEKSFEARVTPVEHELVLAIVRDVTLQKWAMSEREGLIDELEQKNAELERFTYTASHDLKSPLITIRGFLGFVREDARAGDMVRLDRDIQRITDATEKMQRLLGDLLELSRVGRINNKPVNISTNELVAEVVELLQGRILEGNVAVQIAESLPAIHGDRPRISEVFQNLIDNAAKFMGDQSEPRIEIGIRGELEGNPIFFVRDNGIGIAPQFKERIFGLFDKLDATSDGTGIGLALVKRIVEFHGGKIWVESELGKGATFYFSLPHHNR